jgi:ATP-dependent helicase HrpB
LNPRPPLPIDAHLESIARILRAHRAVVVVAPPGSGKTTRVPPALTADGPVILLQPRRVAARAIARRIAAEGGWTVGAEVGWQVRFERQFSAATRLLVVTEGILTARRQADPLLSDFRTVILDEFHERSLHADLALALVKQTLRARDDLRVVVMSATLDAAPVRAFLDDCPIVEVPGRLHPVETTHAPDLDMAAAVRRVLARPGGHVLCFLPGAPEIRRVEAELRRHADGVDLLPLHGSLDADRQDAALAPSARRKVILATNIAETSLTVEGVTDVIDSGLQKVMRLDAAIGLERLEVERISVDSATQRAGRAGRTAPGRALRLWSPGELLRAHREPEIARADLAGTVLDLLVCGEDPRRFTWFEAPPAARLDGALKLLDALGAVKDGRITERGRALGRFPLHPRLAQLLLLGGGSEAAAAACAVLSEGWRPFAAVGEGARAGGGRGSAHVDGPAAPATDSDLLAAADRLSEAPHAVRRAAAELHALAVRTLGRGGGPGPAGRTAARTSPTPADASTNHEEDLRRAVLAAWPDRVARRRAPGSPRLVLATGHGAILGRESGLHDGDFLVAVDLAAGARGPGSEAIVRMASRIERPWIAPTRRDVEHRLDVASRSVRAVERSWYQDLVLSESPVTPDTEAAAAILADALLSGGLGAEAESLLRRLRFARLPVEPAELVRVACRGRSSLPASLDLLPHLPHATRREVERLAPTTLLLPSGRRAALDYRDDGSVTAAVKLQELFGLGESPRLGPLKEPITFALLSPSGRPVQTTRDLRSFWERTYPEVRKELRGRYPKHPWPDDPWTATPTHRTTRRSR